MKRAILIAVWVVGASACGGTVTTEPTGTSGGSGGSDASTDSPSKGGGSSTGGSATGGSATGGSATGGSATGGSATGGSATGGASSGGTSSGGTSSGGTSSGGSAGATSSPFVQCKDGDGSPCTLFSDCCTCTAYGPGEPQPPECLADCFVDSCTSLGVPSTQKPLCEVSRCIVGFDCAPAHVFCNALPPECAPGAVASVVNGCWGGCVPASECTNVPSCQTCDKSELCVNQNYSNNDFHCVPAPSECAGVPSSSACLCPLVCPNWNFCSVPEPNRVQCDYI